MGTGAVWLPRLRSKVSGRILQFESAPHLSSGQLALGAGLTAGVEEGYHRGMSKSLAAKIAGITLPDTDNREIRLGSLWEEGPAVVVFLRHYG